MDTNEASACLAERLARYREYPHSRLAESVGSRETENCVGAGGAVYQLEFQVFWDARPDGPIRVIGSIDDGGLRVSAPLCQDFVKAPDGSFVGE